jgi:hypothetical protein
MTLDKINFIQKLSCEIVRTRKPENFAPGIRIPIHWYPNPELDFGNLLRSPGIDSQPGGIDSWFTNTGSGYLFYSHQPNILKFL